MPTHLALSLAVPEVSTISTWGAAVAITIALAAGFYGAVWLRAERDEVRARAGLAEAVRLMWAARRVLAVVGVIVWVMVHLYFRSHGNG
jgi:hypothetical protein